MQFEPTRLPEVVLIKPRVFGDARGFFFESWHEQKFAAAGIDARFVQDNHSHSVRHTLRGLNMSPVISLSVPSCCTTGRDFRPVPIS